MEEVRRVLLGEMDGEAVEEGLVLALVLVELAVLS